MALAAEALEQHKQPLRKKPRSSSIHVVSLAVSFVFYIYQTYQFSRRAAGKNAQETLSLPGFHSQRQSPRATRRAVDATSASVLNQQHDRVRSGLSLKSTPRRDRDSDATRTKTPWVVMEATAAAPLQ